MINVVQLFAMYDVNGLIAIIVNVDIDTKYDTTSLPCIEPNVSRIGDNIPFEVNNKNNTIDENRLQIKMNSFHENLSVIIQFDQWTGKVYLHHTIHCDKRLWKKVKGIDAIILYNNDILSI